MYKRMLIPLDGSKTAETVLPYARSIVSAFKLPVELVGVIDIAALATHVSLDKARYLDTLIADGERSSRAYLENVARSFGGAAVQCAVEKGKPEDVIIEKAATDKGILIAMATHGRSGMNRWLLGSVAEKVLRGATNPLLLVRAPEGAKTEGEATLKSVIVPLDGSELAESVLPSVVELAKKMGSEVVLVRAYELPPHAYYGSEDYLPNYQALTTELKDQVRDYLEEKVEKLKGQGLEKVSSTAVEGAGPDEIIKVARKTQDSLVAMCTHGRSGVKRWVLGSVTEKVVRHSGDPVLVFRAP